MITFTAAFTPGKHYQIHIVKKAQFQGSSTKYLYAEILAQYPEQSIGALNGAVRVSNEYGRSFHQTYLPRVPESLSGEAAKRQRKI
jgi:hypothetical protein